MARIGSFFTTIERTYILYSFLCSLLDHIPRLLISDWDHGTVVCGTWNVCGRVGATSGPDPLTCPPYTIPMLSFFTS